VNLLATFLSRICHRASMQDLPTSCHQTARLAMRRTNYHFYAGRIKVPMDILSCKHGELLERYREWLCVL
jgi:hypothetical protein